jgi:uncharacterized membrane protein YeaQ/YmgE (transglycosylase-associated protein family)
LADPIPGRFRSWTPAGAQILFTESLKRCTVCANPCGGLHRGHRSQNGGFGEAAARMQKGKEGLTMESLIPLLIQLASGALGGNVAGALLKNLSLGTVGNSLAGIVGGGLGSQLLPMLAGPDILSSIVGQVAGGGVGGAILMAIVGVIRKALAK